MHRVRASVAHVGPAREPSTSCATSCCDAVGLRTLVWGGRCWRLLARRAWQLRPAVRRARVRLLLRAGLGAALAAVDVGHGVGGARRGARADARRRSVGASRAAPCGDGRGPAGAAAADVARQRAARPQLQPRRGARLLRAAAAGDRRCTPRPPGCWRRWRFPGAARPSRAFALPVASLLWSLLRLYRDPPVFAFDPFGGYFPGPIYDEALRPPLALLSLPAGEPGLDRRPRSRSRPPRWVAGGTRGAGVARPAAVAAAARWWRRSCCTRWAAACSSGSRAPISRATLDRTMTTDALRPALRAGAKTPRGRRADRRGPRVPLSPAARDAGRRTAGCRSRSGSSRARR